MSSGKSYASLSLSLFLVVGIGHLDYHSATLQDCNLRTASVMDHGVGLDWDGMGDCSQHRTSYGNEIALGISGFEVIRLTASDAYVCQFAGDSTHLCMYDGTESGWSMKVSTT